MFTAINCALICAKATVDGWFRRVFKEQAGGAEIIATLVIVAVVLCLALMFRDNLSTMVANLWNTLMKGAGNKETPTPTIPDWGG